MMRRSVGIGVSVVTAAWVVLGMWTPSASALAPDRQPISFVGHGVIDCGTFVDAFDDFFNGFETIYFDQAGNPIRDVLNLEHHSNDSNSLTGLVVHEHGHFMVSFDLLTGTATVTGNQEIDHPPGHWSRSPGCWPGRVRREWGSHLLRGGNLPQSGASGRANLLRRASLTRTASEQSSYRIWLDDSSPEGIVNVSIL